MKGLSGKGLWLMYGRQLMPGVLPSDYVPIAIGRRQAEWAAVLVLILKQSKPKFG